MLVAPDLTSLRLVAPDLKSLSLVDSLSLLLDLSALNASPATEFKLDLRFLIS